MHFIIYSNFNRDADVLVVDDVINILKKKGYTFSLASYRENESFGHSFKKLSTIIKEDDIVLVVGGDGTVLRAAEDIAFTKLSTPILAINRGECGFLTDIEPIDAESSIDRVINGDYDLDKRTLLEISYNGNNYYALNEFVMYKGSITCPIVVNISLSTGESIMTVHADGAYISTPTGSTAYSLSAGASILAPETKAFVVGAICSHSLLNKSLIVPDDKKFLVRLGKDMATAKIMADGVIVAEITDNSPIYVEKYSKTIDFIKIKNVDFYKKLDDKLSRWNNLYKFFRDTQED